MRESETNTAVLAEAQTALLDGQTERAETLYRNILRDENRNLAALDGLGVICCQQGETQRGIGYFQDALRFVAENDGLSADSSEEERLKSAANQAILLYHLGLAQHSIGQNDEAIQSFRWSLELQPGKSEVLLQLGQLHFELQQYSKAINVFQTLTEYEPQNASAWLTLGYILELDGQYDNAVHALETAFGLDSSSPDACFHLAESLRKSERYEESQPYYQRMLLVADRYPQAVHNYGKILLALGNLQDGWEAMEFRTVATFGTWERHHLPVWNGNTENDETVLAYSEEGIAADLMFASCLPDLIDSAGHCVIECNESLHGLFRRSFPRALLVDNTPETVGSVHIEPATSLNPTGVVHDETYRTKNPWGLSIDKQIAFGSLPRYFRNAEEDFPLKKAYLVPDKPRVERWARNLAGIGSAAKVGILWQGSWTAETESQTALPLRELREMMLRNQSNAAWICLQHGTAQKEAATLCRNSPLQIHIFKEAFQYDLDEAAALITALDLVITPPGYVAHLAGALGVNTWLVLPERADWRWNLCGGNLLWHRSMLVFRQQYNQSWTDVFNEVENHLQTFLSARRPPEENMEENVPVSISISDYEREQPRMKKIG